MSASNNRRLRLGRLESLAAVAGGVTHELSNLAASVLMSVQLLEAYCGDAPGRELLASLDQLARRLQHAGRQLHWLARGVDGESMVFQPQYLLSDLQKLARAAFPGSVTLVTRYPPDLWPLAGDPLIVFQLLLALCLEAREHLQGGGTLVLAARNEAPYVVLEATAEPATAGDRAAAARRRRAAAEARRAAAAAGGFTSPIPRRRSISGRRAYLPAAPLDPTP
jgi:signal transduction histidine kinase